MYVLIVEAILIGIFMGIIVVWSAWFAIPIGIAIFSRISKTVKKWAK